MTITLWASNIQDLFFFLNLTSGNSCSSKFYMLSVQMVSKPCPRMLQLPKKDKICKSCTCETISAKHSFLYATPEEKGGEWEENGASKAERSLETDALHVFTKTTIQEENSPATLHHTRWREREEGFMGCSPWAGARGTVKPAQAGSFFTQQARNIFTDNLRSYLTSRCSR